MSAVEEKARRPGRGPRRQMEPCPKVTRVAQSWNESDADFGDLFLEPNYTAKQTFEPSKHNQQMLVWYIPIIHVSLLEFSRLRNEVTWHQILSAG